MVVKPLPSSPDKPVPQPIGKFSPAEAAVHIGHQREAVRRALVRSKRDGKGRVVEGQWKGAYQTSTGRWIIPADVLGRVLEVRNNNPSTVADLVARVEHLEAQLRAVLAVAPFAARALETAMGEAPDGWPPEVDGDSYEPGVSTERPPQRFSRRGRAQ